MIPKLQPWIKTALAWGTALPSTVIATIAWCNNHAVDLYALWEKIGQTYALIAQIIATAWPLALGLWGIWRTLPLNRITEIANDPASVKAAEQMPATAQTIKLADALKK